MHVCIWRWGQGEINVVKLNSNGTYNSHYNCGYGGAFDFRVGLSNCFFTNDGFVLATSKHAIYPLNLSSIICPYNNAPLPNKPFYGANTYIAKFDNNLNLKWENTYEDEDVSTSPQFPPHNLKKQECMYAVVQTPDGGYLACGNNSNAYDDNYLLKLYADDCGSFITDYDITPNNMNGIPEFSYPSYVIGANAFTGGVTNRTINWSSSKKIKGSVVIKPGYQLIISGANTIISFDDSKQTGLPSKIIVMPGAKLRIENGATLTSFGNCKPGMWDGIEVWGNELLEQDLITHSVIDINYQDETISTKQGLAVLSGGVKIENAKIGITASNPNNIHDESLGNYLTGGIIQANNVHFRNNHIDAEVLWYHNLNINAPFNEIPNKSYFKLCKFENDAILVNPAIVESMICPDEPDEMYTGAHLHLWNVNGVKISGCEFVSKYGLGGSNVIYGKGIEAFDASFEVTYEGYTKTKFTNLEYGILNGSYNGSCIPNQYSTANPAIAKINNSVFTNCLRGIQLDGTILADVNRNNFEINSQFALSYVTASQNSAPLVIGNKPTVPVAIYTNASISYRIMDNIFKSAVNSNNVESYGVVNRNSSAYSTALVSKNNFEEHYIQEQFEESNSKLRSNCNTYDNSTNTHYAWSVFQDLANQGSNSGSDPISAQANIFNRPVPQNSSTCFQDIHLDATGSPFIYYYLSSSFEPTYRSANVDAENRSFNSNFNEACPSRIYGRNRWEMVRGVLHEYQNQLDKYTTIHRIFDDNNTEEMVSYAANNDLNILSTLSNDPNYLLSDEALLAVLDEYSLNGCNDWSSFSNIFLQNSPLSEKVLNYFNSLELPPVLKLAVNNAQAAYNVRNEYEKLLTQIEIEKGGVLNELVSLYLDSSQVDSALYYLNLDPSIGAKMLGQIIDPSNKHGYYFLSNLENAYNLIVRTSAISSRPAELLEFINYYKNELINKATNVSENNFAELLNASSINTLSGIYTSVSLAANNKARYGYNPMPIKIVNGYRVSNSSDLKVEEIKTHTMTANSSNDMLVYPNPAKDNVRIVLPDFNYGKIEIVDVTGKVVFMSNAFNSTFEISLHSIESGMYFIRNSKTSKSVKLTILK